MAYLDPMRFSFSGDQALAQRHMRTARVVAYGLVKLNTEAGVTSGRREITTGDGVKIEVIHAGKDVTAHITAPTLGLGGEITMAYVSTYVSSVPHIWVVDVDAEKIVNTFTFGSLTGKPVVSLCAHPNGKFLYAIFGADTLVKIDLQKESAVGFSLGIAPSLVADMFMSPDGDRVHIRYGATGIPGSDWFYAGYYTYDTEELTQLARHPSQLFSNRTYRGCVHPDFPERMYFPTFGDADGDTNPRTGESDNDYVPDSLLVYDYSGGPLIDGEIIYPYWLASGRGVKEVMIDPKGLRAYACSTRSDSWNDPGGPPLENVPTLFVYDVEGGGLTKVTDLLTGVELTGCVSSNRLGTRVYVAELDTGVVRWFERDDDDTFTEKDPFSYIPEEGTGDGTGHNRGIQHGPKRKLEPDTRMFFLSQASKTMHVFMDGEVEPQRKIVFSNTPGTFALGFARRLVPKEPT